MNAPGAVGGLMTGLAGGNPLGGVVSGATQSLAGVGLNAVSSWVLAGTKSALQEVAHIIGETTTPDLQSSWFSSTYWRVAALASLLTVPFLFAAAMQAVLRSEPALLAKAAFGYLPLAMVGVGLAAPIVMLLLSATDEMCALVSGTGTSGGAQFLDRAAVAAGGASALDGSPFLAVFVGLLTVAAALALTLELLVREAAVYVVVLMLPLAFAALVWPARRVWASRLVELLVSLILSKFVIVAVLSLAGSALGDASNVPQMLTAMALVLLSSFAPWALLRILPFTELAAHTSEGLRHHGRYAGGQMLAFAGAAEGAVDTATSLPSTLRRQAAEAGQPGEPSAFADTPAPRERPAAASGATSSTVGGESVGTKQPSSIFDGQALDADSPSSVSGGDSVHSNGPSEAAGEPPADTISPPLGQASSHAESAGGLESEHAPDTRTSRQQRLAHLDPIFQAEDYALPELHLGPNGWADWVNWAPPEVDGSEPVGGREADGVDFAGSIGEEPGDE